MNKLIKTLCCVMLTFSATDVIAKSNCYVELLSSETGNILENRRLIVIVMVGKELSAFDDCFVDVESSDSM